MEGHLLQTLATVATYGYPLLFLAALAENLFIVGLLVPGDLVVVFGGALSGRGTLSLTTVVAVTAIGAAAGVNVSYALGVRGGVPLLARWGERVGLGPARIDAVENYFRAHGAKTVFLASFVSGIKNLVPAVAGASRMHYGRFLAWSLAGALARALVLVALGYTLGANLERTLRWLSAFNRWTMVVGGLLFSALILGWQLQMRRRRRRRAIVGGKNASDRRGSGLSG